MKSSQLLLLRHSYWFFYLKVVSEILAFQIMLLLIWISAATISTFYLFDIETKDLM